MIYFAGFLTFVNCWNVKWATFVQDFFTYAKLLALIIIIITGVVQLSYGKTEYFTWDYPEGYEPSATKVALSFYSGLFAYNGWNYLNFIIEELKDPVKNLPRAIAISCILVMVVYVLTNIAFFTTLSPAEILASEAVAVTFANRLYGYMAWIIPVFVAMSTFGAVNGILLTSSRLFYAGAIEGQMPQILTMIQTEKSTPAPAVLFVALLSLLYLTSSNITLLINYVGFATWLSIGVAVFCIPWLRWKEPNLPRPIKVNLIFPIVYILATIVITVVPMFEDPVTTGLGALVICSGIPVYLLCIAWKNKPACVKKSIDRVTKIGQLLLVVSDPRLRNRKEKPRYAYVPPVAKVESEFQSSYKSSISIPGLAFNNNKPAVDYESLTSASPLSTPDETTKLIRPLALQVLAQRQCHHKISPKALNRCAANKQLKMLSLVSCRRR
ncbi:unnamed protein product [Allacma fusca]|uniref:Large neutral amino acids transporter small subunit 2 n=1 Tax=Allacma fusca TaxID=39272 RepID=A0A8J2K4I5_9HEXA|nr:unnamed protein product [Allacma fusca]